MHNDVAAVQWLENLPQRWSLSFIFVFLWSSISHPRKKYSTAMCYSGWGISHSRGVAIVYYSSFQPPRWIVAPGKHKSWLWINLNFSPPAQLVSRYNVTLLKQPLRHGIFNMILWWYNALSCVMRICGETKASDRNGVQVCIFHQA